MKWWDTPLGVGETAQHLVRIFSRDGARGIFISASGYTDPAVQQYREALRQRVVFLMNLKEIVDVLDNDGNLAILLKQKVATAITDKNPLIS
jgi:restriction system protein